MSITFDILKEPNGCRIRTDRHIDLTNWEITYRGNRIGCTHKPTEFMYMAPDALFSLGFAFYILYMHTDLTRIARDSGLPIVVYQMSRREADLGTGGTKLKETSHPTIVFYADKLVEFAEKPSELVGDRRAKMVLSRPDRLTPEMRSQFASSGFSLEEIPLNRSPRFYALWRLNPEPLPGAAGR